MITAEHVTMPGRVRYFDHRHDRGHVMFVLAGEIVEDGVTYRVGDVRFSSAGDRHFLTFTQASVCLVMTGNVPLPGCGSRRVAHVGAELTRQLVLRGSAWLDDGAESLMRSSFVSDLAAREAPAWLSEFEEVRLAGGLVNAKGIDAAARMAGVSREHLARSYRRYFGNSVTGAIKARRLHAAWDALTQSEEPLAAVAGDTGFSDQSHMTRHFAEWIGLTPAAVRRAAQRVTRLQDGTLALGL